MKRIVSYLALIITMAASLSCEENIPVQEETTVTEYKVAIITEMDGENRSIWKNTADWANECIDEAQLDIEKKVKLKFEWYDESSTDVDSLAKILRYREDLFCVIGPQHSSNAFKAARRLANTAKTIISFAATSDEFIRAYSGENFFWSLVESDVSQCECILTNLRAYGWDEVSLLAGKSLYGQTFIDWLPFQASETGLNIGNIYRYDDKSDKTEFKEMVADIFSEEHKRDNKIIICAPNDIAEIRILLDEYKSAGEDVPEILFTDQAFTSAFLEMGPLSQYSEGFSPSADPSSGFITAYKARFGKNPSTNEAHFFDAVILAAFAASEVNYGVAADANSAIRHIVSQKNIYGSSKEELRVCRPEGMYKMFNSIKNGIDMYDISGASGNLDFDSGQHSSVAETIYCHWYVRKGEFLPINYFSVDGTNRSESATTTQQWHSNINPLQDSLLNFDYPPLKDNWALLIAGSEGWSNMRHQADVLNMYRILKSNGYDDEHIVLIMEDDIAKNEQNTDPGKVLRYDGTNLYENVTIDYYLHEITVDDIISILNGHDNFILPQVIRSDRNSNILVYWCGHGEPGSLLLGERAIEQGMTEKKMEEYLSKSVKNGNYRKMLWLIETCYAGSVAKASEVVEPQGVLMLTASNENETSKSDVYIDGIWHTNSFSKALMEILEKNPSTSMKDLYNELNKKIIGSHITLYNYLMYGSLYNNYLDEFFIPTGNRSR